MGADLLSHCPRFTENHIFYLSVAEQVLNMTLNYSPLLGEVFNLPPEHEEKLLILLGMEK